MFHLVRTGDDTKPYFSSVAKGLFSSLNAMKNCAFWIDPKTYKLFIQQLRCCSYASPTGENMRCSEDCCQADHCYQQNLVEIVNKTCWRYDQLQLVDE